MRGRVGFGDVLDCSESVSECYCGLEYLASVERP